MCVVRWWLACRFLSLNAFVNIGNEQLGHVRAFRLCIELKRLYRFNVNPKAEHFLVRVSLLWHMVLFGVWGLVKLTILSIEDSSLDIMHGLQRVIGQANTIVVTIPIFDHAILYPLKIRQQLSP